METDRILNKFRLLEIERQLTTELHDARQRFRTAANSERSEASEAYNRALERFKQFVTKGEVPQDLSA